MLPADWLTPVVRVRRRPLGTDPWGATEYGPEERVTLPPALLAWTQGAEQPAGAVPAAVQTPSALWPDQSDIDVAPSDTLIIRGAPWTVTGEPEHWPMGTRAHLKRVTTA